MRFYRCLGILETERNRYCANFPSREDIKLASASRRLCRERNIRPFRIPLSLKPFPNKSHAFLKSTDQMPSKSRKSKIRQPPSTGPFDGLPDDFRGLDRAGAIKLMNLAVDLNPKKSQRSSTLPKSEKNSKSTKRSDTI